MNDGNTPNGESGCLDLTQSLTSCANSEKSLNSSVLYFSHLQYQKFGLPICHSPFLSEIGFGPWLQPGPPLTPCPWQEHIPWFCRPLTKLPTWCAVFQHQAMTNFGPVLKTPVFGQISSLCEWGCPPTQARAQVLRDTDSAQQSRPSCARPSTTDSKDPTTPHTAHKTEPGADRKLNLALDSEVITWRLSPKCCLVLVLVFWQYFVQPEGPGSLAQRKCMPCYHTGAARWTAQSCIKPEVVQ